MKLSRKIALCLVAALVTAMLTSFHCTASENIGSPITLSINGVQIENATVINNSTVYAPFRAVVSAIDPEAVFTWDSKAKATVATGNGMQLVAYAGQNYVDANGRILYSLDGTTRNLDGTLYVAVESVCKAYSLTCTLGWNGAAVEGCGRPIASASEFYDETTLYWMSRIISAESRGESLVGQIAVGNVIMNRTASGSFPNTVYDVIFDKKHGVQFSPTVSGTIYRDPTSQSVLAAKIALEGTMVVDDALYFCPKKASSGSWIVRTRTLVETIGNHSFYA